MFSSRITRLYSSFIILFIFSTSLSAAILPAPPKLDASSYLVMDFLSGQYIAQHNIHEKIKPASLTKMMTVYIVGEELKSGNISLDDTVIVSEKAWRMPGSRMFIEVDTKVSVDNLIKGVVIQSGNDASVALAEYVSGSEDVFAAMMNEYARELGMENTHFVNSTGLPNDNQYTTAEDMAILARGLVRDHPEIYALHSIKEFRYNDISQHNRNQLLWRDDSVDGIKTGYTENAGYCLVASAKRDDMRLITVVMGTDGVNSRTRATQSLLNFAFRFYETHRLYQANESIASSRIWKGAADSLNLGINDELWVTIPRGRYEELDTMIDLNTTIMAPVNRGSVQGSLTVSLDGENLARRPLIALESVNQGSLFERLKDEATLLFQ